MKSSRICTVCALLLLLFTTVLCGMGGKPDAAPLPKSDSGVVDSTPLPKNDSRVADSTPPAYIKAATIRDRSVLRNKQPLTVTFSEPMLAEEALVKDANGAIKALEQKDFPIIVSPEVDAVGRWLSTTTFSFFPKKGFRPGTDYTVLIKEDLRSLAGKPIRYVFPFKTESPAVQRVTPGAVLENGDEVYCRLYISFDMPISVPALRDHLSVTEQDSGKALKIQVPDRGETTMHHEVVVYLGKKRPDITATLDIDKESDENPLGLAQKLSFNFAIPKSADAGVTQLQSSSQTTNRDSDIKFHSPYTSETSRGSINVRFHLSDSLAAHDQKDFIEVSPKLDYTLNSDADAIIIRDVKPGTEISVTMKPGLTDAAGYTLKEKRSSSIIVPDYESAVRFAEPGHLLTPVYGSRVALNIVNVDKVNLTLTRQYDNNLPFMNFEPDDMAQDMMRNIAFKEVTLKGVKKNDIMRRAVDLQEMAKGQRGVFMLDVTGYKKHKDSSGEDYYSYEHNERRLVVLTDIGVTARVFPSGVTIFASNISSANPLYGAEVKVYSRSNQLLASGRTTPDGLFVYKQKEEWDPQLQPSVVTVQKGEGKDSDITFLALESESRLYLEDPGTRPYLGTGYEAFLYPPRGVFRPGEQVDIKAFVRDASHKPPTPFPVLFRIHSSRGLEIAKGSAPLSDEGGADFKFTLPPSAPTGQYTAILTIPGQDDNVIGQCVFSVEDFVPPRLEVTVTPKDAALVAQNELGVELSGQYLFGAPGDGLSYELGYRAAPTGFNPKGWDGYVFGDHERKFSVQTNLKYYIGELDEQGLRDIAFKAPADWMPPALARVLVIGSVEEESGRWVTQTGTFTYFPTPYLLGLKLEGEHLEPGKKAKLHIGAVTPEEKAATDCGKLVFEVFQVQGNWHTIYKNGRYVYTWNEILIPQEKVTLDSKEGKATAEFTPRQRGRYLVRATAKDGGVVASRRLYAWSGGEYMEEEGTGRMDSVELSFDKKEYLPGETARLSVKAPYAGTLILGIEKADQVQNRVIPLPTPATELEIPVTDDMDPNVNVTAWVIRPVKAENKDWFAHRACGMIGLLVSKTPNTLSVHPNLPSRATPSAPLSIPFTVVDSQGTPVEGEFSVALIDEGILSLTTFKTPNPVNFFMERRHSVGRSYDAYDALLRPEAKATPLLTPGGDAGADYQGSLSTQQIFLTSYLPTVRTDANGQGLAQFDIPEYSGKGRLMIIGASHNRFASCEAPVRFAREVVVETSAPRAVAPGDSFEMTVKLFALPPEKDGKALEGAAKLVVSGAGPIALQGELTKELPLQGDGKHPLTHTITIPASASLQAGIATLSVEVSVPGRDDLHFSKTLEIAVRPPYPRTSQTAIALIKAGKEETLAIPGAWMRDKLKTTLSVDKSPVMAVLPMLEYLREYPYGCLEQTVSRAWPYLTLQSVQATLYPDNDQGNNTKAVLSEAVARISSMQTASGGFGLWPGYTTVNHWRSVNAIFFLVEAKSRVSVSPAVLDASLGYLRGLLSLPAESFGSEALGYSTKAYAAFVLTRAGEAPLGWIQHLDEQKKHLRPSGHIFLAGAKALKAGNSKALKELELLPLSKYKLGYNGSLESDMRNQSLLLHMWSLVDPTADKTEKLCLELAQKISKSRWYSVQEAGMASMAFGTYLEKTGGNERGKYTATITPEGGKIISIEDGEPLVTSLNLQPKDGGVLPKLNIKVGGKGQAYCIYNARGTSLDAPEPSSDGLTISRTWKTPEGKEIDLGSGSVTLQKGDRVIVTLKVTTKTPVADIALSDLLPGGLEVENTRLNTAAAAAQQGEDVDREADQGGMFIDMREDRLLVFFDYLYDKQEYSYSLRAVSKGTFVLPPLAADAMYDPRFSAIGKAGVVIIQ